MNYQFTNLNPQRKRKKKWGKLIMFLLTLGAFAVTSYSLKQHDGQLISPLGSGSIKAQESNYSSLEEAVNKPLEGTKGKYAVVVKNLKTSESYSRNKDDSFEPGSLYKLWVMAEVYDQIQKGDLKEDQVLSRGIATLNNDFGISPDVAEQTSGTITKSVSDALHQMITISHNYSALLLSQKIKLSSTKAFLQEHGFNQSRVGTDGDTPKTTASDIAIFYEKLYNEQLANEENTRIMLDLLKKQQLDHKLPKYFPEGTEIAHKTGELGWFSHDGGIVYSDKGDYIIVVLSESESPAGAEDRIALVSKAVYDYFDVKR